MSFSLGTDATIPLSALTFTGQINRRRRHGFAARANLRQILLLAADGVSGPDACWKDGFASVPDDRAAIQA